MTDFFSSEDRIIMQMRPVRYAMGRIRRSVPSIREPIIGWFLLLIAICCTTIALIVIESYIDEYQRQTYNHLVKQQRARRALGNIVQHDVLLIGHHLHHLAMASDAHGVHIYRNKANRQIKSAEETLRVLSIGGTVSEARPANFADVDQIRRTISYQHDPHESIVIEVVELVPLLAKLSAKVDRLSDMVLQKLRMNDPTVQQGLEEDIAFELKAGCALTSRATEFANRIYYETADRVANLEANLDAATSRMAIVRVFTIGTSIILVTIVSGLILVQINRLLNKRRRSESDLRRSQTILETILECIPVGIVIVGPDRRVRKVNASALKTMGHNTEGQIVGEICHETLCPNRVGQCPILDRRQPVDNNRCILVSSTGRHVPILKTVTPVDVDQETVLLEAFFDITDQVRAEEELEEYQKHLEHLVEQRTAGLAQTNQRLEEEIRNHQRTEIELKCSADALKAAVDEMAELKDAAEAANQAKSDFLANMSHEIRTPMTSIVGFADLLQSPETGDEERQNYVATIRRSGQALLELINDILDLSKVESGTMVVDTQECSLLTIVQDAVSLLQPVALKKKLLLEACHHFPLPETIQSDPGRLRQIIVNLVGNAIKFTGRGYVRIHTRIENGHGGSAYVRIDVEDTGIGIPKEAIGHIFEPFTQADSSASRRYGGTGLGLAVSSKTASLLGGEIVARSEPGKGSTFTVTIDPGPLDDVRWLDAMPEIGETSHTVVPKKAKQRWQGKVLLAEDGPDNQRLISLLLRKLGLQVMIAENGAVAYREALQSAEQGSPYDLIFMDMQMPEMDGYEATRQLRLAGWDGPIVALTAHAMASDRDLCLSAGCDDYLTKPIDRERLATVIGDHLQPIAHAPD